MHAVTSDQATRQTALTLNAGVPLRVAKPGSNWGVRSFAPARALFAAGALVMAAIVPVRATELTARDVTSAFFKAAIGQPVDFSARSLVGLDLSGLDFKSARLAGADLTGADLTGANLSGANLTGARLDRATVIRADFSRANLAGATFLRPTVFMTLDNDQRDAPRFAGADLTDARIMASRLDGADFRNANLTRASLGPIDYVWAEGRASQRAVLLSCNFAGAILVDANLANAVLMFADFRGANLTGARLANADLTKADFRGADLTGADLTDANLEDANLTDVRGLASVVGLDTIKNFDKALR